MTTPVHEPKACRSCGARVLWGQLLDEHGQRQRKPDGRIKSIPIDFDPVPNGNVLVFDRPGEGIVCRLLRKGEDAPPDAKRRVPHFSTCVHAAQHRRPRPRPVEPSTDGAARCSESGGQHVESQSTPGFCFLCGDRCNGTGRANG